LFGRYRDWREPAVNALGTRDPPPDEEAPYDEARVDRVQDCRWVVVVVQELGHADDVDLDGAGRILVPPSLRQFATLDRRVVLVGQGNKFELWDEEQWQNRTEQAVAFPAGGLPPELDGFSL